MASMKNNQAVGLKQNVWKWRLLLPGAIQGSALHGHMSMFEESGRGLSADQCFKMHV